MSASLRSFVEVAPGSDFPLGNLPYGIFSPGRTAERRVGVALGDYVVDLAALEATGLFADVPLGDSGTVFDAAVLNRFMGLDRRSWDAVRARLQHLLAAETPTLRDDADLRARVFRRRDDVTMHLPMHVGDYTDFYASREHAMNVGTMFRGPENALQPNWRHLPVGYHGRASSIVVSGTDIRRPIGQRRPETDGGTPRFGPSQQLDFELELGFVIGGGNALSTPIAVDNAADHVFGLVLVNDWSARDIQAWEYVPLGPFLGKNFATTISPWVVPLAALDPFRVPAPGQDPPPLPYLQTDTPWAFDLALEVALQTPAMDMPHPITQVNARGLYWTVAQFVAHHTVGGCNLRPGDLLASGTVSGATPGTAGCLLEKTWRGTRPLTLSTGETRTFLDDGDRVTLRGAAERDGLRIGFGEASGTVLPARRRS
ncbi:MAG: fumarylacetoacetase [Bacteroidota bacterium]